MDMPEDYLYDVGMIRCPCGRMIDERENFCGGCGKPHAEESLNAAAHAHELLMTGHCSTCATFPCFACGQPVLECQGIACQVVEDDDQEVRYEALYHKDCAPKGAV